MPTLTESNERPYDIASEATSVVFKGPFTPRIFSPSWFRTVDLIGDREFEDVEIAVINDEIAQFRMGWIDFHVTTESLQFATTEPDELPRIRDISVGTLNLLGYQPISAMGINRATHTPMPTRELQHKVGDTLAPKAPWSESTTSPGMRSITIWDVRTDGWEGNIGITVEPSFQIEQAVYVGVNDHYDLDRDDLTDVTRDSGFGRRRNVEASLAKREAALTILRTQWDASMRHAEVVYSSVMRTAV